VLYVNPRALALLAFMLLSQPVAAMDYVIDGVPLPQDAKIALGEDARSALQRQWAAVWVGAWGGTLKHILLVESIAEDNAVEVVYAVGDNPLFGIRRSWSRRKGKIDGGRLTLAEAGFSATYDLTDGGALNATYVRGNIRSRATMARADFATLTKAGAVIDWTRGKSQLLRTDLQEAGGAIRLEVVTFKPAGDGPFPLAVINHGSTGKGDNPALFGETWFNIELADFLNERGWIVAFPQRRGRGNSDGLYDEGFSEDRAEGYSCDPKITLAGADRGLRDIEAAVAVLRRQPDVLQSPLLLGGQSRGGALSVAYAGSHPEQVEGVINFVGGWVGDGCPAAKTINETLFEQGGHFHGPTLWLYGHGDPFYSVQHSRQNFAAFQKAGGRGTFLDFNVLGGDGHRVIAHSTLWAAPVGDYLRSIAVPAKD
jgi:dienelactone hydrolase